VTRSRSDEELLVLGRAARLIEQLEDPRAQARVATYLYHRYTSAGEVILPAEERRGMREVAGDVLPQQLPLAGTDPGPPPAPPAAPTPAGGPPAAPTPPAAPAAATAASTTTTEPAQTGLNLSGNGSDRDDEDLPPDLPDNVRSNPGRQNQPRAPRAKPAPAPKVTENKDGGWDLNEQDPPADDPNAEVVVKI
jgi:hypothetical protein